MTKQRALVFGAIAFAVAALDGAFKIAAQRLPPDTAELAWPVAVALHKNAGIVANVPVPFVIVVPVTLGICALLMHMVWQNRIASPHVSLAGAVLLFGALGNLVDRLINGYTTDYLIFFQRSAVNLADGLILLGAVLLAWYSKGTPRNV